MILKEKKKKKIRQGVWDRGVIELRKKQMLTQQKFS